MKQNCAWIGIEPLTNQIYNIFQWSNLRKLFSSQVLSWAKSQASIKAPEVYLKQNNFDKYVKTFWVCILP